MFCKEISTDTLAENFSAKYKWDMPILFMSLDLQKKVRE